MADEDFHALLRSEGTQATRLGSDIESRFWLSFAPMKRRTDHVSGLLALQSRGCILKMSALQGSLSQAAAAMFC